MNQKIHFVTRPSALQYVTAQGVKKEDTKITLCQYQGLTIARISEMWLPGERTGYRVQFFFPSDGSDNPVKVIADNSLDSAKTTISNLFNSFMQKITAQAVADTQALININRATLEQLQVLRHIGPTRAKKIIKYRPFKDVYELSNVLGLGEVRMREILKQGVTTK